MKDTLPRYAPDAVIVVLSRRGLSRGKVPVTGYVAHPPHNHPPECPLRADITALECKTVYGSRWYGCDRAWINSELRMVVQGFEARFEEMAAWEPAREN